MLGTANPLMDASLRTRVYAMRGGNGLLDKTDAAFIAGLDSRPNLHPIQANHPGLRCVLGLGPNSVVAPGGEVIPGDHPVTLLQHRAAAKVMKGRLGALAKRYGHLTGLVPGASALSLWEIALLCEWKCTLWVHAPQRMAYDVSRRQFSHLESLVQNHAEAPFAKVLERSFDQVDETQRPMTIRHNRVTIHLLPTMFEEGLVAWLRDAKKLDFLVDSYVTLNCGLNPSFPGIYPYREMIAARFPRVVMWSLAPRQGVIVGAQVCAKLGLPISDFHYVLPLLETDVTICPNGNKDLYMMTHPGHSKPYTGLISQFVYVAGVTQSPDDAFLAFNRLQAKFPWLGFAPVANEFCSIDGFTPEWATIGLVESTQFEVGVRTCEYVTEFTYVPGFGDGIMDKNIRYRGVSASLMPTKLMNLLAKPTVLKTNDDQQLTSIGQVLNVRMGLTAMINSSESQPYQDLWNNLEYCYKQGIAMCIYLRSKRGDQTLAGQMAHFVPMKCLPTMLVKLKRGANAFTGGAYDAMPQFMKDHPNYETKTLVRARGQGHDSFFDHVGPRPLRWLEVDWVEREVRRYPQTFMWWQNGLPFARMPLFWNQLYVSVKYWFPNSVPEGCLYHALSKHVPGAEQARQWLLQSEKYSYAHQVRFAVAVAHSAGINVGIINREREIVHFLKIREEGVLTLFDLGHGHVTIARVTVKLRPGVREGECVRLAFASGGKTTLKTHESRILYTLTDGPVFAEPPADGLSELLEPTNRAEIGEFGGLRGWDTRNLVPYSKGKPKTVGLPGTKIIIVCGDQLARARRVLGAKLPDLNVQVDDTDADINLVQTFPQEYESVAARIGVKRYDLDVPGRYHLNLDDERIGMLHNKVKGTEEMTLEQYALHRLAKECEFMPFRVPYKTLHRNNGGGFVVKGDAPPLRDRLRATFFLAVLVLGETDGLFELPPELQAIAKRLRWPASDPNRHMEDYLKEEGDCVPWSEWRCQFGGYSDEFAGKKVATMHPTGSVDGEMEIRLWEELPAAYQTVPFGLLYEWLLPFEPRAVEVQAVAVEASEDDSDESEASDDDGTESEEMSDQSDEEEQQLHPIVARISDMYRNHFKPGHRVTFPHAFISLWRAEYLNDLRTRSIKICDDENERHKFGHLERMIDLVEAYEPKDFTIDLCSFVACAGGGKTTAGKKVIEQLLVDGIIARKPTFATCALAQERRRELVEKDFPNVRNVEGDKLPKDVLVDEPFAQFLPYLIVTLAANRVQCALFTGDPDQIRGYHEDPEKNAWFGLALEYVMRGSRVEFPESKRCTTDLIRRLNPAVTGREGQTPIRVQVCATAHLAAHMAKIKKVVDEGGGACEMITITKRGLMFAPKTATARQGDTIRGTKEHPVDLVIVILGGWKNMVKQRSVFGEHPEICPFLYVAGTRAAEHVRVTFVVDELVFQKFTQCFDMQDVELVGVEHLRTGYTPGSAPSFEKLAFGDRDFCEGVQMQMHVTNNNLHAQKVSMSGNIAVVRKGIVRDSPDIATANDYPKVAGVQVFPVNAMYKAGRMVKHRTHYHGLSNDLWHELTLSWKELLPLSEIGRDQRPILLRDQIKKCCEIAGTKMNMDLISQNVKLLMSRDRYFLGHPNGFHVIHTATGLETPNVFLERLATVNVASLREQGIRVIDSAALENAGRYFTRVFMENAGITPAFMEEVLERNTFENAAIQKLVNLAFAEDGESGAQDLDDEATALPKDTFLHADEVKVAKNATGDIEVGLSMRYTGMNKNQRKGVNFDVLGVSDGTTEHQVVKMTITDVIKTWVQNPKSGQSVNAMPRSMSKGWALGAVMMWLQNCIEASMKTVSWSAAVGSDIDAAWQRFAPHAAKSRRRYEVDEVKQDTTYSELPFEIFCEYARRVFGAISLEATFVSKVIDYIKTIHVGMTTCGGMMRFVFKLPSGHFITLGINTMTMNVMTHVLCSVRMCWKAKELQCNNPITGKRTTIALDRCEHLGDDLYAYNFGPCGTMSCAQGDDEMLATDGELIIPKFMKEQRILELKVHTDEQIPGGWGMYFCNSVCVYDGRPKEAKYCTARLAMRVPCKPFTKSNDPQIPEFIKSVHTLMLPWMQEGEWGPELTVIAQRTGISPEMLLTATQQLIGLAGIAMKRIPKILVKETLWSNDTELL